MPARVSEAIVLRTYPFQEADLIVSFLAWLGRPYRVRVRPPCFYIYAEYPQLIRGAMVADMAAVLGSLNVVAGELDR